jgi:hypothetical protein
MRTIPLLRRTRRLDDRGMATAEYAVGTCAAAGLGGLLFQLLTGDGVLDLLTGLVGRAFSLVL